MKYLKDTKIAYYKTAERWQDDEGAWHKGGETLVGTLWANVKGKDFSEYYALNATWAEPVYNVTFTRPRFDVALGDHVGWGGRFYKIQSINDLTGKVGVDVKVTAQLDTHYRP